MNYYYCMFKQVKKNILRIMCKEVYSLRRIKFNFLNPMGRSQWTRGLRQLSNSQFSNSRQLTGRKRAQLGTLKSSVVVEGTLGDSIVITQFELVSFFIRGPYVLFWARRRTNLTICYCDFPQSLHDANTETVREN